MTKNSNGPRPTGPDMHPMTGSLGDPGIPLQSPTPAPTTPRRVNLSLDDDSDIPGPRRSSSTAAAATPALGPTTLDWSVDPSANTQDQVNSIYGAPTIVNPPPAPAATTAPGLAGIRRAPMGGKAMQLNAGMR